jgi:dishevelled associated activator of morphogenesis
VQGTIWTELDDSRLYKQLDLAEVDRLFSAYQKNGIMSASTDALNEGPKSVEGSIEDLRLMGTMGRRHKIISVIDSRRAQNCTILLSKLKMSNDDITRAIMSMDARDQFPVDMVEQMLKFTPSPEERALLDEHAEEIDHLARADRFLFELSK